MMINPETIDFVIYHGSGCADGFGSAFAAWKLLGDNAEYYAASHGDSPPDVTGKNVAILDFSYKRKILEKMIESANSLVVVDHHASAQETLSDLPNMIFDMNHSGAVLSWKYFHPDKPVPEFLEYIEDRDLWRWELPDSSDFSAAFQMVPKDFLEYEKFENFNEIESAIVVGAVINDYIESEINRISEKAVDKVLDGLRVKVVNTSSHISAIGNRLSSKSDCDFALMWFYSHEKSTTCVSLRSSSSDIDVSKIAMRFGGGGHRCAAGFGLKLGVHIEDIFED
jgi:oligoribonuclease NrnB/cAMP/cGMP phosphodiesterase (DHH superfamily)